MVAELLKVILTQNEAVGYNNLSTDSINSWGNLKKAFHCHYIHIYDTKIDIFDLQAVKQRYDEMLKSFFKRWKRLHHKNTTCITQGGHLGMWWVQDTWCTMEIVDIQQKII